MLTICKDPIYIIHARHFKCKESCVWVSLEISCVFKKKCTYWRFTINVHALINSCVSNFVTIKYLFKSLNLHTALMTLNL